MRGDGPIARRAVRSTRLRHSKGNPGSCAIRAAKNSLCGRREPRISNRLQRIHAPLQLHRVRLGFRFDAVLQSRTLSGFACAGGSGWLGAGSAWLHVAPSAKYASAASRQKRTVLALRKNENIVTVKAFALLLPASALVGADEHTAIRFVVDHAGVHRLRGLVVHQQRRYLALREARIRSLKSGCASSLARMPLRSVASRTCSNCADRRRHR